MLYNLKTLLGLIPDPEKWGQMKQEALTRVFGTMHNEVAHAIFPFSVGGSLDLYYFAHHIPGTAVVTQELINEEGKGPSNRKHRAFEICMFTRHLLDLSNAQNTETPFGRMHKRISAILNVAARYSFEATLNPNETAEFPPDFEEVGGACFIFNDYSPGGKKLTIGKKTFGLLAVIEVHRAEMQFAQTNGGRSLIMRLKGKGYYPYSDLDRDPVV